MPHSQLDLPENSFNWLISSSLPPSLRRQRCKAPLLGSGTWQTSGQERPFGTIPSRSAIDFKLTVRHEYTYHEIQFTESPVFGLKQAEVAPNECQSGKSSPEESLMSTISSDPVDEDVLMRGKAYCFALGIPGPRRD